MKVLVLIVTAVCSLSVFAQNIGHRITVEDSYSTEMYNSGSLEGKNKVSSFLDDSNSPERKKFYTSVNSIRKTEYIENIIRRQSEALSKVISNSSISSELNYRDDVTNLLAEFQGAIRAIYNITEDSNFNIEIMDENIDLGSENKALNLEGNIQSDIEKEVLILLVDRYAKYRELLFEIIFKTKKGIFQIDNGFGSVEGESINNSIRNNIKDIRNIKLKQSLESRVEAV